jgi:hypothetical protein
MEPVEVHLGEIIDQPGELIQHVYFPLRSAISVTDILDERHTVEVTITGSEGCSGASIVQGSDRAVCMTLVQIGGPAIRVPAAALLSHLSHLPYLQGALQRYNALLLRHAVISVGCSRFHSNHQRLARWLMAHCDRTALKTFPFTMEFLGAQAGLDGNTVTQVVDDFQRHGLVMRGHHTISITDHDGLAKACCECFALCNQATEEYLAALQEIARANRGE